MELTAYYKGQHSRRSGRLTPTPDTGPNLVPLSDRTNMPASSQFAAMRNAPPNGRATMNKTGGSNGWGVGPSAFVTQGLQNQGRDSAIDNSMGSYAQAMSGSQAQTPLDLNSDFPSLTSNAQSQSQQPAQSFWNSRAAQQDHLQSQQRQQRSPTQHQSNVRSHQTGRDAFQTSHSEADADRFNSQGNASTSRTAISDSTDPWPRIGETVRQHDMAQFGGYESDNFGSNLFSSGVDRRRQANTTGNIGSSDPTRITSPDGGNQALMNSRSPMSQTLNGTIGQERPSGDLANLPPGLDRTTRQSDFSRTMPQTLLTQQTQTPSAVGAQDADTPTSANQGQGQATVEQILNSMSEKDRFGMAGYLAMARGPNAETRSLTLGQDIHTVGLDLRQSAPLHPTFLGPFAAPGAPPPRPLDSEFTIPACYNVQNVIPLEQRINGFTEETLFYIFYSRPRDIIQEQVAEELMGRKWRFHMKEKMWVTRDEAAPSPVEVERGVSESGTYIWWDYKQWRKSRRQWVLRYEDLDDHLSRGSGINGVGLGNGSGTGGLGNGGFNAVPGLERLAAGMGGRF